MGIDARARSAVDQRHLVVAQRQRDDEPTEPFPLHSAEPRPRRKSWPPALLAELARRTGRRIANRASGDPDAS